MLIYHGLFAAFIPFLSDQLASRIDKFFCLVFFCLITAKQLIYAKWLLNVKSYRENLINKSLFHNSLNAKTEKIE